MEDLQVPLTQIDDTSPRRRGRPRTSLPLAVVEAVAAGVPIAKAAEDAQIPEVTVRNYMKRHAAEMGDLTRVKAPELMGAFHDLAFRAFEKTMDPRASLVDLRNASIVMGVSTDKLQLLAGQPTQIVAGLHAHRVDLPGIAAKLARVAEQLPEVVDAEP